ncbi:MAG: AAA family ATPase [Chitinophagales bacterium]
MSDIINSLFNDKSVQISENIILGDEKKTAIVAEKLSSGEQQVLGFLIYNAFSEKTVFFIDEPELSLHIDWQRQLLPKLMEQNSSNQFFIATHSPFIYSKFPDKEHILDKEN